MTALHPDALRLLDMVRLAGRPRFETLAPLDARALYAAGRHVTQPPPEDMASVRDLILPSGVAMRLYRPVADATVLPLLVFCHGGGWVFGDLETHDQLCRVLANAAGCALLAVDYRLAPEHPFPAAVEDALEALHYAAAHAEALGIDAGRIAVGGDSAGGNLAAVLALLARDGAAPPIRFQLLLYPVTDMAQVSEAYARFTDGVALTSPTMRWFRALYAPDPASWNDWRASPLRAASLAGTAPAYVLTVAHDPLCDEGRDYARRLEAEGVPVMAVHLSDQMHGCLTMSKIITPAQGVLRMAAAALREALV